MHCLYSAPDLNRWYRPHGISLLIIYIYHNTPFPLNMASVWCIKKETAYQNSSLFFMFVYRFSPFDSITSRYQYAESLRILF